MGQVGANPAGRLDEIDAVVVVLGNAGGDRKNVGVEDDVFGRKAHLLGEQLVGSCTDRGLALEGIGLPLLIEGHHDDGCAITPAQPGLAQELGLAFFHRDAVDDRFALHAAQPSLDHRPLRGVDHDRHPGDIGLGRNQIQEARHRGHRIEHRLVHVDIDDLRAVFDLLARHLQRLVVLLGEDQPGKGLRAGDIGALADIHEERRFIDIEGLKTRQPQRRGALGHLARRHRLDGLCNRRDVFGRGAAAAAGDVHETGLRKFGQQRRGDLGRLVEAGIGHRIGQPGIRIDADEGIGLLGELLDIGAHEGRAERAVKTHRDRAGMADRIPEGLDRLARQDATRGIGDRAGDHDRQAPAEPLEALVDRKERGLRVQGIEHGFNQQNIDAAFHQRFGLLDIGRAQLLEADVAGTRIIDVGRNRGGFRLWAECTGHEARLVGRAVSVGRLTGDARRGEVHLARQLGHAVVGLRDGGRTESVGLDDVGAGSQIAGMDLGNHLRTGDREQLVVAFDVVGEVGQPLAAIVGFGELVALDHGAHGTVEDQDAPGEQLAKADFDRTCGLIRRRQKSTGRSGHEAAFFGRRSLRW